MREQISFSSLRVLKTALIREGSIFGDNARWIKLSSAGVSKERKNEPGARGGGLELMELTTFGERGCGGIASVNRNRVGDVFIQYGCAARHPSSGAEQRRLIREDTDS